MKFKPIVREEASEMILTVLIWAVASLLSTRLYLNLTGYPVIGGGSWHVAHALFGGVIMTGAMLSNLTLHSYRVRKGSAAFFGIGLGLFIDEIGKYLSSDNDYFFRPAIILIYIFFMALFLAYRYFDKKNHQDAKTWLYQVIARMEEIAEGDLEDKEKTAILKKIGAVIVRSRGQTKDFAQKLQRLVMSANTIDDKGLNWTGRTWNSIRQDLFNRFFKRKIFWYVLAILTGVYVVGGVLDYLYLLPRFKENELINYWFREQNLLSRTDIVLFNLKSAADLVTAVMFVLGSAAAFRRKIKAGIGYFQAGLLVNIFFSSVFKFYFEQFSGVFGLFGSIIIYFGLTELRKELAK